MPAGGGTTRGRQRSLSRVHAAVPIHRAQPVYVPTANYVRPSVAGPQRTRRTRPHFTYHAPAPERTTNSANSPRVRHARIQHAKRVIDARRRAYNARYLAEITPLIGALARSRDPAVRHYQRFLAEQTPLIGALARNRDPAWRADLRRQNRLPFQRAAWNAVSRSPVGQGVLNAFSQMVWDQMRPRTGARNRNAPPTSLNVLPIGYGGVSLSSPGRPIQLAPDTVRGLLGSGKWRNTIFPPESPDAANQSRRALTHEMTHSRLQGWNRAGVSTGVGTSGVASRVASNSVEGQAEQVSRDLSPAIYRALGMTYNTSPNQNAEYAGYEQAWRKATGQQLPMTRQQRLIALWNQQNRR